jgi:DNA helicase-2/ATP-dependent DNA helicase PcrA
LVEFSWLCRAVVEPAQRVAEQRESLANPAEAWLSRVARVDRLAVMDVQLRELRDLVTLHGYVLEPALRSGTAVAIESQQRLTRLAPEHFVDPGFEYPYTLERAIEVATRLYRGFAEPPAERLVPPAALALDAEQRRAAQAHDGVVQVIAPAGSGKTAVLIERVRELLRRGVPAERILCTTFNRDARVELQQRLRAVGLDAVAARTFHSIGWWLMREEGLARRGGPREMSFNQWKRLCALALREEGAWIDPGDARAAIGAIKLGLLASPREFSRQAGQQADGPALLRIYELYERHLADEAVHDFDDLVLVAVRALREDAALRRRWQSRFWDVLVDEYQDIEPAQELLVRILAAPHDGFFCVGDEDQTLYGWRRASVRRIIDLDLAYPGLERVSLAHNYRCPKEIVDASRALIGHNKVRFPKQIDADPDRPPGGMHALQLHEHASQPDAADEIATVLAGRHRAEIVVLARTTNLLRTVALACAELGVKITAPERVFEPHGARGALEAYLRLCAEPQHAQPDHVVLVCRAPGRGLPFEAEQRVAQWLRGGLTFTDSLAGLRASEGQRGRLADAGRILDALAAITDARRFIAYLRGPGGLDEYFTDYEQAFGDTEKIELEVLEQAQREASGKTVAEYARLLQARSDALRMVRDDVHGIELTTIHRAKGRQWPEVHLFGCEENQLPHRRALEVSEQQRAAGEGLEAERRLAYVAFTRAQETLVLHTTEAAASRFLTEAGLEPARPYASPAPELPASAHRPPSLPKRIGKGPVAAVLNEAVRVGLAYALSNAPSRSVALEAAAAAVEQRLMGPVTASNRMSVTQLLMAVEQLSDSERATALDAIRPGNGDALAARLGTGARKSLVQALRRLASGSAASPQSKARGAPERRPQPLASELDANIVRLVADHPGELGRAQLAQILSGTDGRKVKASYAHLPEFGCYRHVPQEQLRKRIARLIDGGQLEARGKNQPRLWTP